MYMPWNALECLGMGLVEQVQNDLAFKYKMT